MPETYTHLTLEKRALMQVLLDHNLSLRTLARNHARPPDPCMAPAPGRPAIAGAYRCDHA
jgi:hypothetical protein